MKIQAKIRRWTLPVLSILSLIWILIRVIPKPQRATYPCMRVAFPFAATLIAYAATLGTSLIFFRKALKRLATNRLLPATFLLLAALVMGFGSILTQQKQAKAGIVGAAGLDTYEDPLGPNAPIGEAKGILPGRVVWVHDPNATNENCDSDNYGDAYFMEKNANQDLVDAMLDTALLQVTGKSSATEAWDTIFRYFNSTHDKGDVGFVDGEKIFIKVNAVHAWTTNGDLSIRNDGGYTAGGSYGNVDTSPHAIMAVLRQLVYEAGVPQDAIYLADPLTNIMKHVYEKLSAEFPDVHYMSRNNGFIREKLSMTNEDTLFYSDRGSILQTDHHTFYDCFVEADYILNIPAIKGHRWGGVTFFAKNHFGSNTADGSWRLHPGLHRAGSYDLPVSGEYKTYRVMVDLMAYEHMGGKTLIYIGDFLWGTSYEHHPPMKFRSAPFNDDWTSSILVSMDPVAIASVGVDILQEELQEEDLTTDPPRYTYVRYSAVDDYLHQAASSEWWPEGIVYDPEDDGIPMGSLGVHEHWNNPTDKQYSRNLNPEADGIELLYISTWVDHTSTGNTPLDEAGLKVWLNSQQQLNLEFPEGWQENTLVRIVNSAGQLVLQEQVEPGISGASAVLSVAGLDAGFYVLTADGGPGYRASHKFVVGR